MNVSVIVPCFNSHLVIGACLRSILQDADGSSHTVEIIAVDDGSTDNTAAVIHTFNTVRYIYMDNMGPAAARNRGAKAATGDLLLFTDSDCQVLPGWIDAMVQPFLENAAVSAVKGAYRTHQEDTIARFCQLEFEERYRLMERQNFIDFVDTYSAAVKRDAFWEVGGFNESFPFPNNEDVDLSYRMASHNFLMVFNPNAIVLHRHKTRLLDYMKLKFSRAYWRMIVYNRYPEKIIRDSYTPQSLKIQLVLAVCLLTALVLSLWHYRLFSQIFLAGCGVFCLICLPFALRALKEGPLMAVVSIPLLFFRAASFAAGIAAALIPIDFYRLLRGGLVLIDTISLTGSLVLAFHLRSTLLAPYLPAFNHTLPVYLVPLPILLVAWLSILHLYRLYTINALSPGITFFNRLCQSTMGFVFTLAALAFFVKFDYSRVILLLIFPPLLLLSLILRTLWYKLALFMIRNGYGLRRAVIVGTAETAHLLAQKMERYPNLGYRFVGFISREGGDSRERVIGRLDNLAHIIKHFQIDEVFFADPYMKTEAIFSLISRTSFDKTSFKVVTNLFDILFKPVDLESISDVPLLDLREQEPSLVYKLCKRLMDLVLAALLLSLLALPLTCVLLVLAAFGLPRLRREAVVGYRGRSFAMWRIPIGLLRDKGPAGRIFFRLFSRFYVDEWLQLVNVIQGTMSLVGPRPEREDIVKAYEDWQRRRLEAKPGITGLWQIMCSRNKRPLHADLEYDFYYIRNRSLLLDASIMLKTILFVLFRIN